MRITDAFLGEHGVFYAQFAACEQTLLAADPDCLRREAALIASALEPHAQLEDALLFNHLRDHAGGEETIFHVMEREHAEIEAILQQIQRTRDVDRARDLVLDVIHAAREHFAREEHIAFPLAEQLIGSAESLRLARRWAEARGVGVAEAPPG